MMSLIMLPNFQSQLMSRYKRSCYNLKVHCIWPGHMLIQISDLLEALQSYWKGLLKDPICKLESWIIIHSQDCLIKYQIQDLGH